MATDPEDPVSKGIEVAGYVADAALWGPDRSGPCPCGSRIIARLCHSDADGQWHEPPPQPLLHGPRTGLANAICYAQSSRDCSDKPSKEHWISKNILKAMYDEAGNPPLFEGFPWLAGERKAIPAGALDSRILCKRHNNALSKLDATAGRVFRALHAYQKELRPTAALSPKRFLYVSGSQFELWLLKLAMGGLKSRSFCSRSDPNHVPLEHFARGIAPGELVEILFRGAPWPDDWGFHAFPRDIDPLASSGQLSLACLTAPEDTGLAGLRVDIGVVGVDLVLAKPSGALIHRPGAIALYRRGRGIEKVIALGWSTSGHNVLTYTRAD